MKKKNNLKDIGIMIIGFIFSVYPGDKQWLAKKMHNINRAHREIKTSKTTTLMNVNESICMYINILYNLGTGMY